MAKASEKKLEYDAEYKKANYRRVMIMLHNIHDVELIKWIESIPNKQGYLKKLMQADMDRHNAERIRGNKDEEQ